MAKVCDRCGYGSGPGVIRQSAELRSALEGVQSAELRSAIGTVVRSLWSLHCAVQSATLLVQGKGFVVNEGN